MDQGPLLIRGGLAVLAGGLSRVDIHCEGGRVAALGQDLPATAARIIDAAGHVVGPGFIDIHAHGGGGFSFFSRDPGAIRRYAAWAPRHGLTSFLVSTLGASHDDTAATLESLRSALACPGAEPLGFHLEGPFLSPGRHGAFPRAFLQVPESAPFSRFQRAAGGSIRQVTIAPELPGALALTRQVIEADVVAAMGHTDATASQAREGFAAGIRHVTHLFNAMRPFHQREAGPGVAALLDSRVTCELICDGVHVAPDSLRLAYRLLGQDRFVLVTDNMELAGTPGSMASFVGGDVTVAGGAATRPDGTIVGSVAPIDQQVRNAIAWLGLDLSTAFQVASANPAAVAGVSARKGSIEPGKDADLVILDADNYVAVTICRGVVAFQRDA